MRRIAPLFIALTLIATTVSAQVKMGVGIALPTFARNIPIEAHLADGVVKVDRTLDASPQILIEVHRSFKMGTKFGLAPMLGFCPKVDFGLSQNTSGEQPLGAGLGMLVATQAGQKHYVNLGLMWLVTAPVTQLDPMWADGFQAPRSRFDLPLDPQYRRGSVSRVMVVMTISGLF